MDKGYDGGVVEQCLAQDYAHIDSRFRQSAVRESHRLDESHALVHQQYPRLFGVEVLHLGQHILIYRHGRTHVGPLSRTNSLSPLAQFASSDNRYGLRLANAIVAHQLVERHLSKRIQVVITVGKDALHQSYSTLLGRTRPDKNGKQFGIGQCRRTFCHELLARFVLFSPLIY